MFGSCSTRCPDLDWLRGQALRRLPEHIVDDVVQETLLAGWRGAATRERASARTWLNGVLRHKIADFYRRDDSAWLVEMQEREWAKAVDLNDAHLLRFMLRDLPRHYEDILWLHFWAGLTLPECATALGCSVDAAKSRYRRAITAARRWWLC